MKPAPLTAELIETFAGLFLSPRYDAPSPTPQLHREGWKLYCSPHPQCMFIAPREHAKSTALTFVYIMAAVCFRNADYVILVGSTEDMAAEQLSNIREELLTNDDLRAEVGIANFEQDSKTDIIVKCEDGHRFRIIARGAEQKIRGKMWKGKRPNLLVCDDMEDDEQVENKDRRTKFRRWFFRAARQALSKYGKVRVHGTILHEDSLLSRLRKNPEWQHLFYKAHRSFDDFTDLLWPEQWPEERLRARQREFVADGDAAGYSQEFLNDPQDNSESYLRRDDFIDMSMADYEKQKVFYVGCDFAVSKTDMANRTSFTVGGKDIDNVIHHVDFQVGRWSSTVSPAERDRGVQGWIDVMFDIQRRWEPELFFVEGGVIWKSIEQTIYNEMTLRDTFINIKILNPIKDKAARGRSFQKRHRAGATRWNTKASGYEGAREEMLRFTGNAAARLDDQFDSCATLHVGLDKTAPVAEDDFMDDDEREMERGDPRRNYGQCETTGY